MTPNSARPGIGMLSVFGLPPTELVQLAAVLGCQHVSVTVQGVPLVPLGYPPFSLKDDAVLRNDLLAVLADRGVTISLGDGFLVMPGTDVQALSAVLDVLAYLAASVCNIVCLVLDLEQIFFQYVFVTE